MIVTNIKIRKTNKFGKYRITGVVNGVEIGTTTKDESPTIDFCKFKLIQAFNNLSIGGRLI